MPSGFPVNTGFPKGHFIKLLNYQNAEYDTINLAKELVALFPDIESFSLEQTKTYEIHTDELVTKLIAIIDAKSPLSAQDEERIKSWISVKTSMDNVELYINSPAPLTMPSNNNLPSVTNVPISPESNTVTASTVN